MTQCLFNGRNRVPVVSRSVQFPVFLCDGDEEGEVEKCKCLTVHLVDAGIWFSHGLSNPREHFIGMRLPRTKEVVWRYKERVYNMTPSPVLGTSVIIYWGGESRKCKKQYQVVLAAEVLVGPGDVLLHWLVSREEGTAALHTPFPHGVVVSKLVQLWFVDYVFFGGGLCFTACKVQSAKRCTVHGTQTLVLHGRL